jgi:hypothetical protein
MPWDGDLQSLERAIAAVNAEYDAFLYGSGARPPLESRKKVERMVRTLSAQDPESAADRYRFSTLQGRWNSLCERWERLQSEKEAGRRPGLYGHFQPAPTAGNEAAPGRKPNAAPPASVGAGGNDSLRADARRELFEKYVAARRAQGASGAGLDFERFSESLEREAERVRARFGGAEVEFEVAEREGKVKLVAKRKS